MMNEHKSWTHRLHTCTVNDDIAPLQRLGANDGHQPNGPVLNVKQAYYWSIVLLTWPRLLSRVPACSMSGGRDFHTSSTPSRSRMETHRHMTISPLGDVDGSNRTLRHIESHARGRLSSHVPMFSDGNTPMSSDLPNSRVVDSHGLRGLRTGPDLVLGGPMLDQLWEFADIAELANVEIDTGS